VTRLFEWWWWGIRDLGRYWGFMWIVWIPALAFIVFVGFAISTVIGCIGVSTIAAVFIILPTVAGKWVLG
jgi:hypothetical protein